VSLSSDPVLKVLKTRFVCGWKNITGESYAGKSGKHETDGQAVSTTNGAGPHNVQMFMLDRDGTVVHCLLGFWAPADLLRELDFGLSMDKLYRAPNVSAEVKKRKFVEANFHHIRLHPPDMIARSRLQSFDAKHEADDPSSDFKFHPGDFMPNLVLPGKKNGVLKTTDQVLHERMARRAFVSYEAFDVAEFSDFGKTRYDKKEDTREPNVRVMSARPRR
jgi:hypothetical protein